MTRKLWGLGVVVFVLTLLLNMPAAFVARFIPWSPDWQPVAVAGSVWKGRMDRLGAVGPLVWRLQPWIGEGKVTAGFQQRSWELQLSGWPWLWQAQLALGGSQITAQTGYVVDGDWQGSLRIKGRGTTCQSSEGELRGRDVALIAPWTVVLGSAQLKLECRVGLQLLVDVQREGEHRFEARIEPVVRRIKLNGWVEPDAMVTPLLVQAGMLKAGASQFERVLGAPIL